MSRPRVIAVIGTGEDEPAACEAAYAVGKGLAEAGCVVITGGLQGVMQAASRGAQEANGLVIAVVPGANPDDANPWVSVAVASGMGDARNAILANTAEAFIAVAGSYGTLSEIAFALKRGKRVVSLGSWDVDPSLIHADDPVDAIKRVLA